MKLFKIMTVMLCLHAPLSYTMPTKNFQLVTTTKDGDLIVPSMSKINAELNEVTDAIATKLQTNSIKLISCAGLTTIGAIVLGKGLYNCCFDKSASHEQDPWWKFLMHKSTGGAVVLGGALMYASLKMVLNK